MDSSEMEFTMTLNEIDRSLPNGFHDAEINRIQIDYEKREAIFEMNLWVGDENNFEKYRAAKLLLIGLIYLCVEPPDKNYKYYERNSLWIEAGPMHELKESPKINLPRPIPDDAFEYWFFVRDWNSFIYVSATSAELIWAQ